MRVWSMSHSTSFTSASPIPTPPLPGSRCHTLVQLQLPCPVAVLRWGAAPAEQGDTSMVLPSLPTGERVRELRRRQGRTQAAVAGLCGITTDYLSQIERGHKTPSSDVVARL
ncbi:helix-turn-helix transcriptional regulator, partial [Streptomyces sp. NRRL S-15]|uniref:helix-turn-helix domain-containing protein n=1 Tax=Streptomyces sp. NRRL S-15 TaxID=1463886 RepID=UPI002D219650